MKRSRSSRTKRGRRSRRRNTGSGIGRKVALGAAIIAIPAVTLGAGGYLAYQYLNTEQIDANYCYARPDQHEVAVFIDFSMTHQLSPSQRRDLTNTLRQTFENLPPNAQLSVFTSAKGIAASVSEPVFQLCNPAENAVEQASFDAPATSTPKLARQNREAQETFAIFIDDLMAQSVDQAHLAISSPILEQIQGLSRYNFGGGLDRLIVFTDGINNSANGEFCSKQGHLPSFSAYAARPEYTFIAPENFGRAQIDILLVESTVLPNDFLPYCTNAEVRNFWVEYFEANGSGSVRLTPLGLGAAQ